MTTPLSHDDSSPGARPPSSRAPASAEPRPHPLPGVLAGALVFGAAAAVLVLEILAGRILAPYVGVTLETYSAIIGMVLAGIACGTWAGGWFADHLDPRSMLGPVLVAGGLLAVATLPVVRGLANLAVANQGAGGAVLLLAMFGFFPPAAVLSAVTPTVAKLQLASLHQTGAVVGRLSALGTAGALVGTFVTGFFLVADFATTPIVLALGAALVASGVAVGAILRGGRAGTGTGASGPATAVLAVLALAAGALAVGDRCQLETGYHCARVEPDPDRPGGRLLLLDTLSHSYVDVRDPTHLEFDYTKTIGDAIAIFRPARRRVDALHIGGGGFTLPRHLAAKRPGSRSLVLEVDAALPDLARERLGLRTGADLRVRAVDARVGLREQPRGAYDLVVGDAFGGVAVPWHLTTIELVRDVRRTLRPRGLYALNLIDWPPSDFARAEVRTLLRGFRHVALVAPPALTRGEDGGNFILLASQAPLPLDALRRRIAAREGDEAITTGRALERFAGDAPVLTDEYAPVDQLLTPTPAAPSG